MSDALEYLLQSALSSAVWFAIGSLSTLAYIHRRDSRKGHHR